MKKIISILSIIIAMTACHEDRLQFDTITSSNQIIGFDKSKVNVAYFEDLGAKDLMVPIVIKGFGDGNTLNNKDITLKYTVVTNNSDATEGVEYNFANTNKTLTIPAGSNFVNIPLKVNTGKLNATKPTKVQIKIESSSEIISYQNQSVDVTFIGCKTNLEGNYKFGTKSAVITKVAPNRYRSSYLPTFAANYWFEFTDVCGVLEIVDWQFQGSYPLTGTEGGNAFGMVEANGNLTFSHVNVKDISFMVDKTFTLVKI